ADRLTRAEPRSLGLLAFAGDIHGDREQFSRARPLWNRMMSVERGRRDGYLQAATVFWDYFRFDDALRIIASARTRLRNPALLGYEAGAIYENKRDYPKAIDEYVAASLSSDETSPARRRLLALARRPV